MSLLLRPLLFVAAFICAAPAHAQDNFLSIAEDMPAPAALVETAPAVAFMGPEGMVIATTAQGAIEEGAVRAFYAQSLPQLGWSQAPGEALAFRRGRERLDIVLETGAGGAPLTAHFTLVARAPAAQ